jgi:hypothetical protein
MVFTCRICNDKLSQVPDGKSYNCKCGLTGTDSSFYCIYSFGIPAKEEKLNARQKKFLKFYLGKLREHINSEVVSLCSRDDLYIVGTIKH